MPNLLDCSRIPFFLLLQAIVFCSATAADTPQSPAPEGRPDYCGVWGIWGGERVSTEGRPWFKGVVVTSEWNRIEPRPGEFAWDALDRKVREVVDKGLTVMIMIYHGHKVREWAMSKESLVSRPMHGSTSCSADSARTRFAWTRRPSPIGE